MQTFPKSTQPDTPKNKKKFLASYFWDYIEFHSDTLSQAACTPIGSCILLIGQHSMAAYTRHYRQRSCRPRSRLSMSSTIGTWRPCSMCTRRSSIGQGSMRCLRASAMAETRHSTVRPPTRTISVTGPGQARHLSLWWEATSCRLHQKLAYECLEAPLDNICVKHEITNLYRKTCKHKY